MDNRKIVTAYLRLRDARTALKRDYEDADVKLKEKMTKLEAVLLKELQDSKTDSMSTEAGTFYKQEELTPTGSDWDAFFNWCKSQPGTDGFEFVERRIKKTAIKEYMETHEGGIPPGVSVYREYVVRVRRK